MTRPRPRPLPSRPTLAVVVGLVALLAALAPAGPAAAKDSTRVRRGHLPAIGEIKLTKTKGGRVEISVPVTYTKALTGRARGSESAEVTLHIGRRLSRHSVVETAFARTHRHHLSTGGTIVDRFHLGRRISHWLLGRPRRERGRLVRIDVRHRIGAPGRPLHEKDASLSMAASHQARPQGESAVLVLRNASSEPIMTASEPILCMYTGGEFGSDLQALTRPPEEPLEPGETIEAEVQGSDNAGENAVYLGGTDMSAGEWFDWSGVEIEVINHLIGVDLTPFMLGLDLTEHCNAQASTFMLIASNPQGEAASSQAWVLTSETCRQGCPSSNLPTAYEALAVQGPGEEEFNPGIWAEESTKILEHLVGGWWEPPMGGKIVQDDGLHWNTRELGEVEEDEEEQEWGRGSAEKTFELSVGSGSSPRGFSG